MELKNIFKFTKQKPVIKLNGYKYLGVHQTQEGINYYIRKCDEYNNYEFMEARIDKLPRLFKPYVLGAGTSVKILDTFMMTYLEHRNEILKDKKFDIDEFIKLGKLNINSFNEEFLDLYTSKVPLEIKLDVNYMDALKDDYQLLYLINSETPQRKFGKVQVVLVKEYHQKFVGQDISYVCFKIMEYIVRPQFIKEGKGSKYMYFEHQPLNIPTSLLK